VTLAKARRPYKKNKAMNKDNNRSATQSPCEKKKFHDGVVVEIDGERHVLEAVKGTGRNGSCTQCSLDEVCDRFKNALCNGLAGYDDDHIFVRQE